MTQNIIKDMEIGHEISIFLFIDVQVLIYKHLLCQVA